VRPVVGATAGAGSGGGTASGTQPTTSTMRSALPRSTVSRIVPSDATGTTVVAAYVAADTAVSTGRSAEVAVVRTDTTVSGSTERYDVTRTATAATPFVGTAPTPVTCTTTSRLEPDQDEAAVARHGASRPVPDFVLSTRIGATGTRSVPAPTGTAPPLPQPASHGGATTAPDQNDV
jgi:hypothetical protein